MKLSKTLTFGSWTPGALADFLFRKERRMALFLDLPLEKRIELLDAVTTNVRRELLTRIPEAELVTILEAVDPDKATDLLQLLSKRRREKTLLLMSEEMKSSLSTLLEFDPETAAGLMTLDYIQASPDENIASVAKKFRQHERRTGRPPVILVVAENKLKGFLPGHELGFARQSELIGKYVRRIPSISFAASHDEVARLFRAHPHGKVAVLGENDAIIGIIYSDDVLKLLQDQRSSSLYNFAGISKEESVTDTAKHKVKNRYRWLIINLVTAFMAASVVGLFEGTLEKYVLLAVYMPIVAGMGGNAATQTLAVLVRGITLKQIELKTAWRTLRSELGAGFINGIINAILVAAVVIVVNQDVKIALILAMAMIANLLVASFFGTLVPLIMAKLGKDPATSATIFITTATDVLGFLSFLGLAKLLLG